MDNTRRMTVNNFEVETSNPYPAWTSIKYEGKEIVRIHHREIKDLEYALGRIRDELREILPTNDKHEA